MDEFTANGVSRKMLIMVVMTHLHRDHVGWTCVQQDGKYTSNVPERPLLDERQGLGVSITRGAASRFPNAPSCVWPLAELGLVEFMQGKTDPEP